MTLWSTICRIKPPNMKNICEYRCQKLRPTSRIAYHGWYRPYDLSVILLKFCSIVENILIHTYLVLLTILVSVVVIVSTPPLRSEAWLQIINMIINMVAGGQISPFPMDFDRRHYNTLALPCECVIYTPWVKKQDTKLLANFTKYYPIFKMFSQADSVVNLQQIRV